MNQLELNKQVAEAYGVDAFRNCLADKVSTDKYNSHIIAIPLHQDTLTLFRLCIEHDISVEPYHDHVICHVMDKDISIIEQYKNHSTKEAATCGAMFDALAKLKGIE